MLTEVQKGSGNDFSERISERIIYIFSRECIGCWPRVTRAPDLLSRQIKNGAANEVALLMYVERGGAIGIVGVTAR